MRMRRSGTISASSGDGVVWEVTDMVETNKESKLGKVIGTGVLAVTCVVLGGLGVKLMPKGGPKGPDMAAMMNRPQTIAWTEVKEMEYNFPERYVAHAEAVQEVDLVPQVDGYIKEILFKEGDLVKEGQPLYLLDDEKYQAVVGQHRATLRAAETELRLAKRFLERITNTDARGIILKDRDSAEAAVDTAEASVMQAKANLVVAEYNCKKAKIVAPITGKIGKSDVHVGDLVSPSGKKLAHIVQIDPIRVSFPMTDRAFVAMRLAAKRGKAVDQRMRLILPDGTEYDQQGVWDFDDNIMSRETASVMVRLSFANPDRLLIPNTYVTLLSDFKNPPKYPMVPQTAITDAVGGSLCVYVLKDDQTVEQRIVETKPMFRGFVPCVKGLKIGEKVISSGVNKMRPGCKVIAVQATSNEENDANYKGFKL